LTSLAKNILYASEPYERQFNSYIKQNTMPISSKYCQRKRLPVRLDIRWWTQCNHQN